MLKLKKIAVTGGCASGKTTFCRELQSSGAYYISADQVIHHILQKDQKIIKQLVALLGSQIMTDGMVDRAKVARLIFDSKEKLKQVESILHPAVKKEIKTLYQKIQKLHQYLLFVVEVPLLFEARMQRSYDAVVTILTNEKKAALRYMMGSENPMEEYARRMQHQLPPKEKAKRSDIIITNDRSIKELQEKARALYQALIKQQGVTTLSL